MNLKEESVFFIPAAKTSRYTITKKKKKKERKKEKKAYRISQENSPVTPLPAVKKIQK